MDMAVQRPILVTACSLQLSQPSASLLSRSALQRLAGPCGRWRRGQDAALRVWSLALLRAPWSLLIPDTFPGLGL